MTDLIERAIDGWADKTERDAAGKVDGHDITLFKETYQAEQRGPLEWRVSVYVDSDSPLPTEQEKGLTAGEAQAKFDKLVDKYGLREV